MKQAKALRAKQKDNLKPKGTNQQAEEEKTWSHVKSVAPQRERQRNNQKSTPKQKEERSELKKRNKR